MAHRLVIADRGAEHRHRWGGSCACGQWTAVPHRRKLEVEEQYRRHRDIATPGHKPPGAPKSGPRRRRPTPVDKLPEELRRTS